MVLSVLSLFCGCGGLDWGFHAHGAFAVRRAVDSLPHAVATYNRNFAPGTTAVVGDVRDLLAAGHELGFAPDVVVGGPPCQDFSTAGKQVLGERASLTSAFCAVVERYRPRFFVMENVPAIRRRGGAILADATARFRAAGYGLTARVVYMPDYGVPQTRRRLFVLGERGGADDGLAAALDAAKAPVASVREYMARHPGVDMGLGGKAFVYQSPRNFNCRGVFSVDELHPTVLGRVRDMPARYAFHRGDRCTDRAAVANPTVESMARVQTFPESFAFDGLRKSAVLVGNAVPPAFSRVLARVVAERARARRGGAP